MNVDIPKRISQQIGFLIDRRGITKKKFVEEGLREACATALAKLGIDA